MGGFQESALVGMGLCGSLRNHTHLDPRRGNPCGSGGCWRNIMRSNIFVAQNGDLGKDTGLLWDNCSCMGIDLLISFGRSGVAELIQESLKQGSILTWILPCFYSSSSTIFMYSAKMASRRSSSSTGRNSSSSSSPVTTSMMMTSPSSSSWSRGYKMA